ncbi:zinc ribbon domain-containing protein [Allobaculum mucilyticum]|uniref:zinc ribbon domain-containing protein n=1 Tax=Allobaculum mucilyticum TaxID=2834459 RepID=UPI001E39513C|nr:zinc ribbon domain-containing protein [Allobaculum mucilyticum]UNT97218.1 zinc ribbon domain-containing protein [Allobaculum mucilyticum]
MKCPVCHSRIPDDASYCPNCRTRLNNASAGGQFEELESEETVLMGNKSASRHSKKGAAPRRNGSAGFDFSVMDHSYLSHDKLTREEVENMDNIHKKKIREFENARVPVHVSRFVPTGMMPDAEYGNVLQRRQQQNASVSYAQPDSTAAAQPAYSSSSQHQAQPSYKDRAMSADRDTGSSSGGKPKKKKGLIIGIVCAVVVAALAVGVKFFIESKNLWVAITKMEIYSQVDGDSAGDSLEPGEEVTVVSSKETKDGAKWGQIGSNQWIKLEEDEPENGLKQNAAKCIKTDKTYKVTSGSVTVYKYPGANAQNGQDNQDSSAPEETTGTEENSMTEKSDVPSDASDPDPYPPLDEKTENPEPLVVESENSEKTIGAGDSRPIRRDEGPKEISGNSGQDTPMLDSSINPYQSMRSNGELGSGSSRPGVVFQNHEVHVSAEATIQLENGETETWGKVDHTDDDSRDIRGWILINDSVELVESTESTSAESSVESTEASSADSSSVETSMESAEDSDPENREPGEPSGTCSRREQVEVDENIDVGG